MYPTSGLAIRVVSSAPEFALPGDKAEEIDRIVERAEKFFKGRYA